VHLVGFILRNRKKMYMLLPTRSDVRQISLLGFFASCVCVSVFVAFECYKRLLPFRVRYVICELNTL